MDKITLAARYFRHQHKPIDVHLSLEARVEIEANMQAIEYGMSKNTLRTSSTLNKTQCYVQMKYRTGSADNTIALTGCSRELQATFKRHYTIKPLA